MDSQHIEVGRCLIGTHRQARKLISGPSLAVKIRLLSCSRIQSRVVTRLLAGHSILTRRLCSMGLIDCPLCRRCGAAEETWPHILCECEALVTLRRTKLGSFFLDLEDVRSLSLGAVLNYSRGTGLRWLGHQIMGHKAPVEWPMSIATGRTPNLITIIFKYNLY